jgi:hypothetical protein
MNRRLRAICDLSMSSVREYTGRHEYDGRIEDLSPEGVRAGLARLGGPPEDDPHDDAHLAAFERLVRLELGELELHRSNPLYHIGALDVSCYDRDYAPAAERAEGPPPPPGRLAGGRRRRRHRPGPGRRPGGRGPAAGRPGPDGRPRPGTGGSGEPQRGAPVGREGSGEPQRGAPVSRPDDPVVERALAAHRRLVAHLEAAAADGHHDTALGRGPLERLLGTGEAIEVDLGRLEERADAERDRLRAMLDEACGDSSPAGPPPRWWPGSWTTTPTPAGCCPRPRP